METIRRYALLMLLALSLATLAVPAALAQYDGYDNDADGEIDEQDELQVGTGSHYMGRTEDICNATAQIEACLFANNLFCREFALPQSCALASIGNHCNGGDPEYCRYYTDLMQANMRCGTGDQPSCVWLNQQPVIADFR